MRPRKVSRSVRKEAKIRWGGKRGTTRGLKVSKLDGEKIGAEGGLR